MQVVLITGMYGLVGGNILRLYQSGFFDNYSLRFSNHKFHNLTDENQVKTLFEHHKPDYVINCAAVVGGVKFNKENPDKLYHDNVLINTHMIHHAAKYNIKRLISFSSACAYSPELTSFSEEDIHKGMPFQNNLAYGYAKRLVDLQTSIYNKTHKRNDLVLVPTSLYGENDNFSLENGHFIASLIHKTYLAKLKDEPLVLWGDGSPLRELLYAEDLAKICIELLDKEIPENRLIVSSGQEVTIKEAAETIAELMEYKGKIHWDTERPNGQLRKHADISRLKKVLPEFNFIPFKDALKKTIDFFLKNQNVRC